MDLPHIIAHRGAPRLAPENTLQSLQAAKACGARWTEFDVTLSADHIPVVFHDDTLDRTTNGHGAIVEKSFSELRALSAGRWFHEKFAPCSIPTLSEYLTLARELALGINVELKPIAPERCQTLCEKVLSSLSIEWPSHLPMPLLSSFSEENLVMLRKLQCPYPLALNVTHWSVEKLELAQSLQCYSIHCNAKEITEEKVAANTKAGLKTLVYTVNDKALAQKLLSFGVTAVFSDIPDLLD